MHRVRLQIQLPTRWKGKWLQDWLLVEGASVRSYAHECNAQEVAQLQSARMGARPNNLDTSTAMGYRSQGRRRPRALTEATHLWQQGHDAGMAWGSRGVMATTPARSVCA